MKELKTRRGTIQFPAYIPVTTYGNRYPLDKLIRPYLPRLAQAMMVSWSYAPRADEDINLPLLLDSGGFACLFDGAKIEKRGPISVLKVPSRDKEGETEVIHPRKVLELQEEIADVAFTLDFPSPPGLSKRQSERRRRLTIDNAIWAAQNRRNREMKLYGCIQAWDAESAGKSAREYVSVGFDGIAIGGLVPRARDAGLVDSIVSAVREEIPDLPLHCFGLGKPETVTRLFELGVDSVDSSSYVKSAANGESWFAANRASEDISSTARMLIALRNLRYTNGYLTQQSECFGYQQEVATLSL